jgi:hypothetical protein
VADQRFTLGKQTVVASKLKFRIPSVGVLRFLVETQFRCGLSFLQL